MSQKAKAENFFELVIYESLSDLSKNSPFL